MQQTGQTSESPTLSIDDLLGILTTGLTKESWYIHADLALEAIFQQREKLTPATRQTFARLACEYFSKVLPAREAAYRSRSASLSSPQLARARLLLSQCQQLGWYFKYTLPQADWLNFCQKMGDVLFIQGYYETEAWPDFSAATPEPAVSTKPAVTDLAQSIAGDPALYLYHDQLMRRISASLRASLDIGSDLIPVAKTKTNIAIGAAAEGLSTLSTIVPILGGMVGTGIKAASVLYDAKSQLSQYRQAAKQANWVITGHDCDCLAQELALALTTLRKPFFNRWTYS